MNPLRSWSEQCREVKPPPVDPRVAELLALVRKLVVARDRKRALALIEELLR